MLRNKTSLKVMYTRHLATFKHSKYCKVKSAVAKFLTCLILCKQSNISLHHTIQNFDMGRT